MFFQGCGKFSNQSLKTVANIVYKMQGILHMCFSTAQLSVIHLTPAALATLKEA